MARQAKRKQVRRPGLAEFARHAGVTYSHARRCLIGERKSASMLRRYRAWQQEQRELRKSLRQSVELQAGMINDHKIIQRQRQFGDQSPIITCLPK